MARTWGHGEKSTGGVVVSTTLPLAALGRRIDVEVTAFASAKDGCPVVLIDTDEDPTEMGFRLRLNDALATGWDGEQVGFVSVAELAALMNENSDGDGWSGADICEALAELIEQHGGWVQGANGWVRS